MLFGVIGKARSGKDTFSKILAKVIFNKHKSRYTIMAFATALKNKVQKDFDMSWEQLWGEHKEVPDERYFNLLTGRYWTPREILQSYGEFYRGIDPNYWVSALFDIIDDNEIKNVIISDVRHLEETTAVTSRGGITIKVEREDRSEINGASHISEVSLDDYEADFTIDNTGTIKDLTNATLNVVNVIFNENKIGGFI